MVRWKMNESGGEHAVTLKYLKAAMKNRGQARLTTPCGWN